jgi:hypothetical protein
MPDPWEEEPVPQAQPAASPTEPAPEIPWEQTEEGREAFAGIGSPIITPEAGAEPPETTPAVPTVPSVLAGSPSDYTEQQRFEQRVADMGGLENVRAYQEAINRQLKLMGQEEGYIPPESMEKAWEQYQIDKAALETEGLPTYKEKLKWEREVMPTLPKEYQAAYKAKDTREMERLRQQYQRELEELASWEANVLPTLPKAYQEAYRAGDTDKLAELSSQ